MFRLVRAVADLPCFTHILCYDRQIITHAVEYALNIEDGSRYLQKIIQLSFKLPGLKPLIYAMNFASGLRRCISKLIINRQTLECQGSRRGDGYVWWRTDATGDPSGD
ncbi:P-loop NTPase fold protein [Klebsiella pneumoniae]|uniref:P-loop NTPase fold protein n=1 Tax=Klebsiella pneumoniae TaxID=573 RepID=UPI0024BDC92E|nr:P-loop NTPase fold protein [Klebsiella pneumoniae]